MPLFSATSPLPVNMERRRLFNPSRISGLDLWLDAADGDTLFDATSGGNFVSTNGSAVKRWEDKSGNSRHAIEATSAPTLLTNAKNNFNALNFATSKYITCSFTAINYTKQAVFLVFNYSTNALNFARYFSQTVSGNADFTFSGGVIPMLRNALTNGIGIFKNGTGLVCNVGTANNVWYIARYLHTGSAMTLRLNAVTSASDSHTLNISPNRFRIGADISAVDLASQYANCTVSEVLLYNRNISDSESTQITDYLNSKWAVY